MIKQRIFFVFLVVLFCFPVAHAQLIRGYDTFHHGISISSSAALRDHTLLKKIYFRKIIGLNATRYMISAYDEEYHSLFTEQTPLKIIVDQDSVYLLTPEKSVSPIRLHPFYETELSATDAMLSPELINALRDATSAELVFSFEDLSTHTYPLPQKKLDEWKKIIASKS